MPHFPIPSFSISSFQRVTFRPLLPMLLALVLLALLGLQACKKGEAQEADMQEKKQMAEKPISPYFRFNLGNFQDFLLEYLPQEDFFQVRSQNNSQSESGITPIIRAKILAEPEYFLQLLAELLERDREHPYLSRLVDKQHPLATDYSPPDLVDLAAWQAQLKAEGQPEPLLLRKGLKLRRVLLPDLQLMIATAKRQNIELPIASSYRSYNYQDDVFRRYSKRDGLDAANRYSARPGQSQHQLGLAIDFAPISQAFAQTPASAWLIENALDYGFSLSYPQDGEGETGYIYEPWHYRYVGPITAEILTRYFGAYQQAFMLFWHEAKPALQEQYTPE